MSDHYRTLGLPDNASKSDIKNAYFRLAHRYHPDHHAKADAASRAAVAASFRRVKDAYEVLSDDRRRAEYDRTLRSSSSWSTASSSANRNRQGSQYGGGASSGSSSGHGNRQHGQHGSGGASSRSSGGGTSNSNSKESGPDWMERERARARCNGGGTYSSRSSGGGNRKEYCGGTASSSSSSGTGNRKGQYGGGASSSSSGRSDTSSSSTESGTEWIFERARARGGGGTSSSTASGHGGGFGSRWPPPRVPRPMVALVVGCAGVIGGSALLYWSLYNSTNDPEGSKRAEDEKARKIAEDKARENFNKWKFI